MDHVKPTQAELDEQIRKSQEELDKIEATPPVEPEPSEPPEEVPPAPSQADEEIVESIKTEEPPKVETPPVKPVENDPDYKLKFKSSTQEAQILYAQNKKMNEAWDEAAKLPDPTDDEMRVEYKEWDNMSDFEKKISRGEVANRRRFQRIGEVTQEFRDFDAWKDTVEKMIDDPQTVIDHPELDGKEEELRIFALKPSRKGTPQDDLIASFLWNVKQDKPAPHKGQMFETGTGGPSDKSVPKSTKISVEQSMLLRKSNYPLYRQYLQEGKIEQEVA